MSSPRVRLVGIVVASVVTGLVVASVLFPSHDDIARQQADRVMSDLKSAVGQASASVASMRAQLDAARSVVYQISLTPDAIPAGLRTDVQQEIDALLAMRRQARDQLVAAQQAEIDRHSNPQHMGRLPAMSSILEGDARQKLDHLKALTDQELLSTPPH